jgi:hypothetical protein
MRDLFDPHSFGPPRGNRRLPTRNHRHSRYPRVIDLFDAGSFGPQAGDGQLSTLRRHLEWIGRHEWPARIVIVTGEVALIYLALVFGLLIGVGLSTWIR